MKIGPTFTVDEILKLFKQILGVNIKAPALHYYIKRKNFPESTKWGRPRKWLKKPVLAWFKLQVKNIKN